MLIACVVQAADIPDEDGCEAMLDRAKEHFPQVVERTFGWLVGYRRLSEA